MNLTSICFDIIKETPSLEKELNNYKKDIVTFMAYSHHTLGASIRNNLKLWDTNSTHYKFFEENYKLTHADDMSGLILRKLYLMCNESWVPSIVENYHKHWNQFKTSTFT